MNRNPDDDEAKADEEDKNIIEMLRDTRYDDIMVFVFHFNSYISSTKVKESLRKGHE
jgi:hypothetical protein